ncbi:MAG: carboxypeptidase M32 [bacterium]|nr:carboxypeptidase M32 [bacterium]
MKDALKKLQFELHCYGQAEGVLMCDGETAAPRGAAEARGEVMAFLSQKRYELLVNDETRKLLDTLWEKKDELDGETVRQVEILREDLDELTRIPMEEYAAYGKLVNNSSAAWVKAKETNDYALFEPYLKQIVEYTQRFAHYHRADLPAYESQLDSYEKGMSTAMLDPFFGMLRKELVPMLDMAKSLPPQPAFVSKPCAISAQREFSSWLMDVIGLDKNRCSIAETEHPFTSGMNRSDVRITTHYYENAVLSSLYSVVHEGGHALYELGVAPEYQFSVLGRTSSMSLHESQSRFYENLIGHSAGFLRFIAPKMREFFPDMMQGVTDRDLFRAVNHVQPSLIRIEADQVTYPLHIMVRYELEKQLMAGTLSTRDLPEAWNALYKEYLGVDVPNDSQGVLQDTHWAGGMIGYFPTYALGSAYASQMLHAMQRDLDTDALIERGDIAPITAWLGDRIHRHGSRYEPNDLLKMATGEEFNPAYYVKHLQQVLSNLA